MSIPKLRFIRLSVPDAIDLIRYLNDWSSFLLNSGLPDPEYESTLNQMTAIKLRLQFRLDQVIHHE